MGASESKLTFKEDVFRLAREENIPAHSPWWAQFYQLPESADDVFALWSPNDLRGLTRSASDRPPPGTQVSPKKNFETLIYTCISRLQALVSGHAFLDPHHPIANETLNCVRILTRLLPYVYEADHLIQWDDDFFWQPRKPQQIWDAERGELGAPFDGLDSSKSIKPSDAGVDITQTPLGPPLGELLVDILLTLLFFPNFTLPKKLDKDGTPEFRPFYHIWNSGIGSKQSAAMSKENERNAIEVVGLLIALTSRQLFITPHSVASTNVKALSYLTTRCDRQVALSLICSLLNTVLKYNPATWRVPIDLAPGHDPKSRLVNLCLQFLLILLLYPAPDGEVNAFRKNVSRLHRVEDFQFIQHGLTLVLTQPISGSSPLYLGNQKAVPWAADSLVLFWELLQTNKRFRSFIVETERAHDFLVLVLYYAMASKNEPASQGLVRMCVLILQTLSVESAFGSRLNKLFTGQESLPAVLRINNFHGSYADFLITSIHTLMTTTQGYLESIYPSLLAIIQNVAPHIRDLQRASSSKLMDMFTSLSSPQFLLEKENNHQLLASLLEAMNAILEFQYEANPRYIDIIVRSRQKFYALREFTVEGALTELDRQAQRRKDRASGDLNRLATPLRTNSIDATRNSVPARSPPLEHVPEHSAFAIGDDEDEEDEESIENGVGSSANNRAPVTVSSSASLINSTEQMLPMQSKNMSEKARGKQPVGQNSFSRTTSRNASTASLPTILTSQANSFQQFTPTAAWLGAWLPHLPLHAILVVIDDSLSTSGNAGRLHSGPAASAPGATPRTAAPTTEHSGERPGRQRTSNGNYRPYVVPQHGVMTDSPIDLTTVARVSGNRPAALSVPSDIRVQAFQWTTLSVGWYLSLLWGFIYASDAATNKGINGVWTGTSIRLFNIASRSENISLRSPRGAVDAVGNTIVQRLGSLTFSSAASPTTATTTATTATNIINATREV